MQVRLTTTISTIIEIDPENTDEFETAKREIYTKYVEATEQDAEQDQFIEAVKQLQYGAAHLDTVIATEVTHSFEEVK